jgi:hypothetical protein
LRTSPASKPKNPIRETRARSNQLKLPYNTVASRYPEQKRRGQAKKNWSRIRSMYALIVGFIIRRFAVLTFTPFDLPATTRYQ